MRIFKYCEDIWLKLQMISQLHTDWVALLTTVASESLRLCIHKNQTNRWWLLDAHRDLRSVDNLARLGLDFKKLVRDEHCNTPVKIHWADCVETYIRIHSSPPPNIHIRYDDFIQVCAKIGCIHWWKSMIFFNYLQLYPHFHKLNVNICIYSLYIFYLVQNLPISS